MIYASKFVRFERFTVLHLKRTKKTKQTSAKCKTIPLKVNTAYLVPRWRFVLSECFVWLFYTYSFSVTVSTVIAMKINNISK